MAIQTIKMDHFEFHTKYFSKFQLKMTSLNEISSLLITFIITFIVIYVVQFYYHYFTRPNPLPGPFPLPLIGNVHQSIGIRFNDWMILMHKKYGDMFELYLAGQRAI